MAISNYDYSKQIANLKNAQQKAATADLQATRNQALSNLNAEQQQNAANYATQRSTANAQNRLAARNFQEYLANTGRANSGLGAQANMQYNNNLNTSLNSIYGAENAANADILRRQTDAQNAYNTGLAKANADIQANYIQALIDERAKRWERDMQIAQQKQAEKEFKESIRQFNKNYELQKRNFSSGSGGGGYSYRSGKSSKSGKISSSVPAFTDSQKTKTTNTYLPPVAVAGGISFDANTAKKAGVKVTKSSKGTTYVDKKTVSKKPKTNKTNLKIQLVK